MVNFCKTKNGCVIHTDEFDEQSWLTLKDSYQLGDLIMPCCNTPAIPKTSPNFKKFFAHHSDECATSPESIWHINAKEQIMLALKVLGFSPILEKTGNSDSGSWQADVYFETSNRKVAIEIQHSYQHLRDYLKRQSRYREANVECFWVLYKPRYLTLVKSISKYRIKNEFGGTFPAAGLFPCLPELPIVVLDIESDATPIIAVGGVCSSIAGYLNSLVNNQFIYQKERGVWQIVKDA
ncbi:TPA: competence protein CoiA family protein [Vibrio vulnificus]|nr:hypothetical protein VCSRO191_3414 [Vibrio cholerae]